MFPEEGCFFFLKFINKIAKGEGKKILLDNYCSHLKCLHDDIIILLDSDFKRVYSEVQFFTNLYENQGDNCFWTMS